MSVKETVLNKLEKNRGSYVSGEALAGRLGVSRAAIGKAVKSLRDDGYRIEAVTNKGYMIPSDSGSLTEDVVRRALPRELRSTDLFVYDVIDSTNLQARRLLLDETEASGRGLHGHGLPHGSVIIANQQTAGRGRLGRSFYSPKDGLYMSVIIRPDFDISRSGLITVAAAAAASRAIDEICGCRTEIKWVNDIYLNDRKISGILTEAATDFESGKIDSLIVGIGINTGDGAFPSGLEDYAGTLRMAGETGSEGSTAGSVPDAHAKAKLAALIISRLLEYAGQLSSDSGTNSGSGQTAAAGTAPEFLDYYRQRCMVLSKHISVYKGKYREDPTVEMGGTPALGIDIDDDGGLIVEYEDGSRETLATGEVSVRRL